MKGLFKIFLFILFIAAIVAGILYLQQLPEEESCPPEGTAREYRVMELNRLKNRTASPAPGDINNAIILAKMLEEGDDRRRWNTGDAAEIIGYVADVKVGGVETCNCKATDPEHRDTHIELVADPMHGGYTKKIIIEITPRIRALAAKKGLDWSTRALRDKLLGRWVKVQGWMLFDFEHLNQADNTHPGGERNWRATAWEIHPVTSIEVINGAARNPI